jgi:hypothetical protein
MKAKDLIIQVCYNPDKKGYKVLENFQANWKSIETEEQDTNGNVVTVIKGIHPFLTAIPVVIIKTNTGEAIKVISKDNKKLLTLEGSKALQLDVLSSMLIGELKRM